MRLLALALRGVFAPTAARFARALDDPATAQARLRAELLDRARSTAYGRRYRRWEEVPVVDWEALRPWVERMERGEAGVLVPGRVDLFEPTSGSTGRPKRVPYPRALRRSFTRMLALHAHDLLARGPRFRTGRLYFSVSPDLGERETTPGGARVGTEDDRDYLAGLGRWLWAPFWVSPPGVKRIADPEAFWRTVATWLAAERRLEAVSVWSPTFFQVLLDWLRAHGEGEARAGDWRALWPELKLVSCWDRAGSAAPAARLRRELEGVLVQGKGLLATEGPVTVPRLGEPDAPLVDEVVVELEDSVGVRPLVDAVEGETYRLVLSTRGGLLRYRLGDEVRVEGRAGRTPSFHLVGRGETVDLVGEKLHERAVAEAVAALGLSGFVALVGRGDHYALVVDRLDRPPDRLVEAMEAALQAGVHYRRARRLGQLGGVRVVVAPGVGDAELAAGRWGGQKHRVLRADGRGLERWLGQDGG